MQEGGQVHQTVHMRGDIALSMNVMPRKKDTMAEGQFSSLSKLPSLSSISKYCDYLNSNFSGVHECLLVLDQENK